MEGWEGLWSPVGGCWVGHLKLGPFPSPSGHSDTGNLSTLPVIARKTTACPIFHLRNLGAVAG